VNPSEPLIDVREVLSKDKVKLPALPEVLVRLRTELACEDPDLRRIESLVLADPVLSGQVLRMAGSAHYSRGTPLTDLRTAIGRLGLRTLEGILYALLMPSLFGVRRGGIDMKAFWKHSFTVASFATAIGRRVGLGAEPLTQLWMAGLMHDLGALILLQVIPVEYPRFLAAVHKLDQQGLLGNSRLDELERRNFSIDHAELGAQFLVKLWAIPPQIAMCIRYHENPGWTMEEEETLRTVVPIHLADLLASHLEADWSPLRLPFHPIEDPGWAKLGLGPEEAQEMVEEVRQGLAEVEQMLSIAS
jgi:HD-like signal output (HDOD) protein